MSDQLIAAATYTTHN